MRRFFGSKADDFLDQSLHTESAHAAPRPHLLTPPPGPRHGASGRPPADAPDRQRLRILAPLFFGISVLGIFFGGLGAWATFAELDSAAVAPGILSVETNRKTIKHLEGGIVAEITVREGQTVEEGQTLIRLDKTQAQARLDLTTSRYYTAMAREARLTAERDGLAEIKFHAVYMAAPKGTLLARLYDSERDIFEARARARSGSLKILRQQIAAYDEEILGLKGQISSQEEQLELISEEISDIAKLMRKGLSRKPRFLALQRQESEIAGSLSQNQADIARIRQSIAETRIRMDELLVDHLNQVVSELGQVQTEMYDLNERIRAAEDILDRTAIRAPISGTVLGLQVHTPGGVVRPGEALLEIVPDGEKLLVDAQVDPKDIDVVRPGLEANVQFSAFSQRDARPLQGRVVTVSADGMIDDVTGSRYYLTRIELDRRGLGALDLADLRPGMQADVFILTGARSPLTYITEPLTRSLQRSLREQ